MSAFDLRLVSSLTLFVGLVFLPIARANAESRVLDGQPVSMLKAQTWCIAPGTDIPSWGGLGHPECKMTWRVLAERDGRVLYSARYAWPSPTRGDDPRRMLTEVLFEGVSRGRVVRRLFAVQEDEARILLAPLRLLQIGGKTFIESRVCMSGTLECGSEFAIWDGGRVERIEDHTVAEIRRGLPQGYDLNTNPQIDLALLSGKGKAWTRNDADCCPSATIAFTLRLDGTELHLQDMQFHLQR